MKIHQLLGRPSSVLARALFEFEKPFTYPLGSETFFRISHGDDYSLFFQAQGSSCCFVADKNGKVLGVLGTTIRELLLPDGTTRVTAYLCDLKIEREARGGMVLLRLGRAAETWLRPQVVAAFGVVMGGTSLLPESYTGRAGIPGFQEVGKVMILRISGSGGIPKNGCKEFFATKGTVLQNYRSLSRGYYACMAGNAELRSEMSPVWLMHPDGAACGLLEDTRKAKRLILRDGSELLTAHLSSFAWKSASSAAQLIDVALKQAAGWGFPALFLAVAEQNASELRAALSNFEVTAAPANVYGAGLERGAWNINTSEI